MKFLGGHEWGNRPNQLVMNGLFDRHFQHSGVVEAVLFLIVMQGCSGTHPYGKPGENVYRADQVAEFQSQTALEKPFMPPIVDEYVVGVGDRMDVVFLFHSNLTTRDLLVRSDGKISLPYVGDHSAAGLTPMTLDSLLSVRYAEILRDPNLSVIITKTAPQQVYVLGEVQQPGAVRFEGELSVLGAVASAGGLRSTAAADHAVLIRREGLDKLIGVELDLKSMMMGRTIQYDLPLRNFDVVYVPQTRLSSTAEFAEELNRIFQTPLDFTFKVFTTLNASAQYEFFRSENRE